MRGRGAACCYGARRYLAPALVSALGDCNVHHGHVRVPKSSVVPDEEGWAAVARGLKLGIQVSERCSPLQYVQHATFSRSRVDEV